jgi:hypothetical protein
VPLYTSSQNKFILLEAKSIKLQFDICLSITLILITILDELYLEVLSSFDNKCRTLPGFLNINQVTNVKKLFSSLIFDSLQIWKEHLEGLSFKTKIIFS